MESALNLCSRLDGFDWTTKEPPPGAYKVVKAMYTAAINDEESEKVSAVPSRYVIKKVEGGYAVIDSVTDTKVETFVHRGLASASARDMNEKESV